MGSRWLPRNYGTRELAIRFALWAELCRDVPSPEQVQAHFNVSRATSYKLLADYRAAKDLPALQRGDGFAAARAALAAKRRAAKEKAA